MVILPHVGRAAPWGLYLLGASRRVGNGLVGRLGVIPADGCLSLPAPRLKKLMIARPGTVGNSESSRVEPHRGEARSVGRGRGLSMWPGCHGLTVVAPS